MSLYYSFFLSFRNTARLQERAMSNPTRHHASAFSTVGSSSRRRTSLQAVSSPAVPSGRFDAIIDMGNPMKGVNLLPYLRRGLEGRALKAMGPATALELSRTVFEDVVPRRWPREVCHHGPSL